MNKNIDHIIQIVKYFRPKFYNKITWIVIIAGISLLSKPIWIDIFISLFPNSQLNIFGKYDWLIGLILILSALIFNLISNYHHLKLSNPIEGTEKKTQKINRTSYLLFSEEKDFQKWIKPVDFHFGLPKHDRNLKSKELDYTEHGQKTTTIFTPSSNPEDKRGYASVKGYIPDDFVSFEMQNKFNFRFTTFEELEEMGIYREKIDVKTEIVKNLHFDEKLKIEIDNIESLVRDQNKIEKGFSIHILCQLDFQSIQRNQYLFDFSDKEKNNRMSVYFNQDGLLHFRIIGKQRNAVVIKIKTGEKFYNNKFHYFNFFFSIEKATKFRIKIDTEEKCFEITESILIFDTEELIGSIGGNLDGQYNLKCKIKRLVINKIQSFPNITEKIRDIIRPRLMISNKVNLDYSKSEEIFVDNNNRIGKVESSNLFDKPNP